MDILVCRHRHYLSSCQFMSSGGAYDTVPEVCILLALFESSRDFVPIVFDEAGGYIQLGFLIVLASYQVVRASCCDAVPPRRP